MKEKFEGFIFDIDGTLTSTNELIFKSFNHIAIEYLDRTFTDEEIIALFGPTEDVILQEWCGKNFENAKKDYYKYYKSHHNYIYCLTRNLHQENYYTHPDRCNED